MNFSLISQFLNAVLTFCTRPFLKLKKYVSASAAGLVFNPDQLDLVCAIPVSTCHFSAIFSDWPPKSQTPKDVDMNQADYDRESGSRSALFCNMVRNGGRASTFNRLPVRTALMSLSGFAECFVSESGNLHLVHVPDHVSVRYCVPVATFGSSAWFLSVLVDGLLMLS